MATKNCTKCRVLKPLADFHRKKTAFDGVTSKCKTCRNAESHEWHLANRERHLAMNLAWYANNAPSARGRTAKWRAAHPEQAKEYLKIWLAGNQERVRATSRVRLRRWKAENRGAVNADKMRRIAAQINATPQWADKTAIRDVYKTAAQLRAQGVDCEVDHIVPLNGVTVRGLHVAANLQIVSATYNRQKSNKTWPNQP